MKSISKEVVGTNLKAARKVAGVTQERVALELGVTRQLISAWEKGISEPSASAVMALAAVYGVPVHALLFGDHYDPELLSRYRITSAQSERSPGR